ncbi:MULTISPECIES: tetratricopeptide repeat protein [Thiorhodovibrio]|uniref:tetratricopeptide repeat protein n=1 Tax=Thiorhodovibrio TaxID=61593 RepID=UPI001F5CBD63|nr:MULTISPECIES: tetratricopeptide repeat protein [Thiorhodovibrio]
MELNPMLISNPSVMSLSVVAAVLLFALGCESNPEQGAGMVQPGVSSFQRIDDLVLVDCLLPGQIRQLGSRMTYLAPRRRVKTTQSDCGIRGGEFVLFDRSDYGNALQSLLPKARAGDAVAQTYAGEIYEKGLGLPSPDYAEAARWYRQAAASGHRPAQTNLGSLYERGLGVPQDQAAALDWYRRATGVTEDRLIFESELKAQQAAFRQEIALRNQVAASLRAQLSRTKAAGNAGGAAPAAASTKSAAAPTSTPAQTAAAQLQPVDRRRLESVAQSLRREAASEQEQVRKQLHAVEKVKQGDTATAASSKKAALVGKLELTLRQRSDALAANQARLAMAP